MGKQIRHSRIAVLALAVMLLTCSGCQKSIGSGESGNDGSANMDSRGDTEKGDAKRGDTKGGGIESGKAMGRYVEEIIDLPAGKNYAAIAQEGDTIRLLDAYGSDLLSADGGETFEEAETLTMAKWGRANAWVTGFSGAADGTRLYWVQNAGGECQWQLVTGENERIILDIPKDAADSYPVSFYGKDYFYSCLGKQIYRTDAVTGNTELLTNTADYPAYLAAADGLLYILSHTGLQIYDLEKGQMSDRQDEFLSEYLNGKSTGYTDGSASVLLYPFEEEVYILTHEGLYRHKLYEETMEPVLDDGYDSITNQDRDFAGMAVLRKEDAAVFLILYSDGSLVRYTYDASLPAAVQADLRIYSVYEDADLRKAVIAFKEAYPELTVSYETGGTEGYGASLSDILNNLSTDIASGNGPDILLMDDLPYRSYVEKGVLAELSDLRKEMEPDAYFTDVIDGLVTEEGLFAVPMSFVVPVLCADTEWEEDAAASENLSDLVRLTEKIRTERSAGSVIGFYTEEEALRRLSLASFGAWQREDGSLNEEAVADFLTQADRIYELQISGLPQTLLSDEYTNTSAGGGSILRSFGDGLVNSMGVSISVLTFWDSIYYPLIASGDPYPFEDGKAPEKWDVLYADYMGNNYEEVNGYLQYLNSTIYPMPGQARGSCIPADLLAVNNMSQHKEESRLFLELVLSEEFQTQGKLLGFPVSKTAYYNRRQNSLNSYYQEENCGSFTIAVQPDTELYFYTWPSEEAFEKLDNILFQITGVSMCDSRVYEAVIEKGIAVLSKEISVEVAVDEIEKALQIYLAE